MQITITVTAEQLDMLRTAVLNQIERHDDAQRQYAGSLPGLSEAEAEQAKALRSVNDILWQRAERAFSEAWEIEP